MIKKVFNNDLIMYSYQNRHVHNVTIALYFRAGIIYEANDKIGISHILEHMFYRKLNNINQKDLYFMYESIGGNLKGTTYKDFISFSITVCPKYIIRAAEILREFFQEFSWTSEEILKEKAVIIKQIEMKNESYNDYIDYFYLGNSIINRPIMGSVESVKRISDNNINLWKKKIINKNNCCLVITGNYSDNDYIELEEKFKSIDYKKNISLTPKKIDIPKFANRSLKSLMIVDFDSEISDVCIIFDVEKSKISPFILDYICNILGVGDGSKLNFVLRDEFGLTDEVNAVIDEFVDFARLKINFSVNNIDLEKSINLCIEEILKIKNEILESDIKSCRKFFTDNQEWLLDNTEDLNFLIGWKSFINSHGDFSINKIIKEYSNITQNDILMTSKDLFTGKNMSMIISNNKSIIKKSKLLNLLIDKRVQLDKS